MPNQSLEEILSRLQITGATNSDTGGPFPNYLVILNADGQIDSSLFSSTLSCYEVADLSEVVSPKYGEIAIVNGNAAYVRSVSGWVLISYTGSTAIPFTPGSSGLASTNIQDAISELAERAVLIDAAKTITEQQTFNVTGEAPFTVNSTSRNHVVTNLNAELLDGETKADLHNAANLTGTINTARLSSVTPYNISIQGTAAYAVEANHAESAAAVDTGVVVPEAEHAIDADTATDATNATNATNLSDGSVQRSGSYYLNATNLNAGTIPAARFDDTSHGNRAGGSLHSVATPSVSGVGGSAGFISAVDKEKLNTVGVGAEVNQNAFSFITVDGTSVSADDETAEVTLISDSDVLTITPNNTNKSIVFTVDFSALQHNDLGGLTTGDPHTQYVNVAGTGRTISAIHQFNTSGAPFSIGGTSVGQLVVGLNAQKLNSQLGSFYQNAANLISGYISVDRINPGDTYPINITGTADGALSTSGGVIDGAVTLDDLTDTSLAGGGLKLIGADNDGKLTQSGINSDLLIEGTTNKFFTDLKLYNSLKDRLLDAADSTLTWDTNDTDKTLTPVLNLTTTEVSEGSNKYLTYTNLNALLATGSNLVNHIKQLTADSNVSVFSQLATAYTIAVRNSTGGLVATDLHGTTLDLSGNATIAGKVTAATATLGDPGSTLVNKDYVESVTSQFGSFAKYDLPIKTGDQLALTSPQDILVGEAVINVEGESYYIINKLPGLTSDDWTDYTGNLVTEASNGSITSIQFGNLLKAANLLNSPASASIFCPELRLSEPFNYNELNTSQAGTASYVNSNFRKVLTNSVQLRGRVGKNYLLLARIQGYVSLRHDWNLVYYTYNPDTEVYDKHTYAIQTATSTQIPQGVGHPTLSEQYVYVDQKYALFVGGKSPVRLEFDARDATITPPLSTSFDGIAPFAEQSDTAKPEFNGGFINIKALSVWSANIDEPFNPYAPDTLPVQVEGELVSGGLNYFPATSANDNRIYDGEDIIDNQANVVGLVKSVDPDGFASYTVDTTNPDAYEKSCVRCSGEATNKHLGINGFLRKVPSLSSGPGLTAPLATSTGAMNSMLISDINKRLAVPLPTSGTFSLFGKTISMSGITTVGQLITAVNTTFADCGTPVSSVAWFTLSYIPSTDRFELVLNCEDKDYSNTPIFDDSSPLLKSLRLIFGVGSDYTTAYSVPQASGVYIANDGSTPLANLTLATAISIYHGDTGSFSIDGNTVTYKLIGTGFDTFASLQDSLAAVGFELEYNKSSNEFIINRIPGFFSDTVALSAPRVYDINGNLMTAMGLEKESHGNNEFPAQSVHSILSLDDGLLLAGDFKSYNTATSSGLAKISLDGRINHKFNVGLGFNAPIYALAELSNGSKDILVSPLEGASYQGYNKKGLFRLTEQGVQSNTTHVLDYPISKDSQDKVLGIMSASNGDFIVLTPRKLTIYNEAGTLLNTYTGSKSFHGLVKWKDEGALTYFVVASSSYSTSTKQQVFTDLTSFDHITPAGLRLLVYNQSNNQITIDNTWQSSDGAGVGAAASCAYPIIGGGDSPYLIAGNRAGWFATGVTDESNADWSWNVTKKGNLFYQSEKLDDSTYWNTNYIDSISTTSGDTTVSVTDSAHNGDAYVEQVFDSTYYQPNTQVAVDNDNPGGVAYEMDVELGLLSGTPPYSLIELRFDNNSESISSYTYSVTVQVDMRNVAMSTRAVMFAPTPPPDDVTLQNISVMAVDDLTNGKTIIKISAKDTNPSNLQVIGRIYPAYNTTANHSSSQPATGTIHIFRTALRYSVWSDWGPSSSSALGFNEVYVQTQDEANGGLKRPSGAGTNSDDFKGLYKISLADGSKGLAFPDFSVSPFGFSEPQAHAIPFGVDSSDNIYVGGPIQSFNVDSTVYNVTPWRIYKLSPLGVYDPTDAFNVNAKFNDKVTSCIVTNADYLVVGGTFTCYNNLAANKLIFLDVNGNPIANIDPSQKDIIEQPTPPSNPSLFDKLWLDTSTTPPVLKIYDADPLVEDWVNIVYSNRQLPKPSFNVTYLNADPVTGVDPSSIQIGVSSALTPIAWDDTASDTGDFSAVKILCQVVSGNTPPVLVGGQLDATDTDNWFDPNDFVSIPDDNLTTETITVYTQIVPSSAMKVARTVVDNSSGTTTTEAPSFVFPSSLVSQTFTINPPAAAPITSPVGPTVSLTAPGSLTITNTGAHPDEVFYYAITDTATVVPPTFSLTSGDWIEYTGVIPVTYSCNIFVVGTEADLRNSVVVGPITFNYAPSVTSGTPTVSIVSPASNNYVVAAVGSGLLYSFNSDFDPSIANYTNHPDQVFYKSLSAGNGTFLISDIVGRVNSSTNSIILKVAAVSVSGSPSTVTAADIVDISAITSYTLNFSPTAKISSESTSIDNLTLAKTGSTATDQHLLYVISSESSTSGTVRYTLVPYDDLGFPIPPTLPTPGTYTGTVAKPGSGSWTIDLNSGVTPPTVSKIISDHRDFDIITYTYRASSTTIFPSVEYFSLVTNNTTNTAVPGNIVKFIWTEVPPSITLQTDATWGVYGFTSTSANSGTLYYSLDPTVNLINSYASNGTVMTSGSSIRIDGNVQQYISNGQLKISVVEVSSGGIAQAIKYVNQISTASPYIKLYSYQRTSPLAALGPINEIGSNNTVNNIDYGTPVGHPLFEIQDASVASISARVVWKDDYNAGVFDYIKYDDTTIDGATVNAYTYSSGDYVGFTPDSADVNSGELRIGARLFAPNYLPSRMLNYLTRFSLPLVEFSDTSGTNSRDFLVTLSSVLTTADIYYTLDGTDPTVTSEVYIDPIPVTANTTIKAIAVPAENDTVWLTSGVASHTYTSPGFTNDLSVGLLNIAFGDAADEYNRKYITLENDTFTTGVTTTNCPIGNSILNPTLNPEGFGFRSVGVGNKNAYWNILNSHSFPDFVPLRNAKGSKNMNNQISARAYMYGAQQFDLSQTLADSGTGTNNHLYVKGIKTADVNSPTTLVEINNLPSGKYAVLAMSVSQTIPAASSPSNIIDGTLNIVNMSSGGLVLSNLSNLSNPAFYFNGRNSYGDIRYYTDNTNSSTRRTEVVGRWQTAIIVPKPGESSEISFSISGYNLIALQIIPVVEFLQPQVVTALSTDKLDDLVYPGLPAGNYGLMYMHGSVKLPETPGFSGESYLLSYNDADNSGALTQTQINEHELYRYNNGAQSSMYYSGSVTYFNHDGGGIKLKYLNSSITNGDYSNNQVMTDNTNFPYKAVGSDYPYIAHGLAYTTDQANLNSTDPVVAPFFALFNQDLIENEETTYLHSPIFIPSLRSVSDLENYGNLVEMYSYTTGSNYDILYTEDGSTPTESGPTTSVYDPMAPPTFTEGTTIKAVVYDNDSPNYYSPVSTIQYFSGLSLGDLTNDKTVAGWNFKAAESSTDDFVDTHSTYSDVLVPSTLTRYGGTTVNPNTKGWLATGNSTSNNVDTAMLYTLNSSSIAYNGVTYDFSITADLSHNLQISSVSSMKVLSEVGYLGAFDNVIQGSIWSNNPTEISNYLAAGWVVLSTMNDYTNLGYYSTQRQPITIGPRKVAFLYSATPDFNDYTLISTSDIYKAGTFNGAGGGFNSITDETDISPDINNGLQNNNIVIPAGQAGYFRLVPYEAIGTQYYFGFKNHKSISTEDITVKAFSTSLSSPISDAGVSSSLSTVTVSPMYIAADNTTTATVTVTVKDLTNLPDTGGKMVTLTSTTSDSSTDVITTTNPVAANGSGVATFTIKSSSGAGAHTSRLSATVLDGSTNIAIDQAPHIRIGETTSSITLSSDEFVADNSTTITATILLKDVTNNPLRNKAISYTGISSGTLTGVTTGISVTSTQTQTDTNGEMVWTIKGSVIGTAVFEFTTADAVTLNTDTITLIPGAVDASSGKSNIYFSSTSSTADGTAYITGTVTLMDAFFNPVAGYRVVPVPMTNLEYHDTSDVPITTYITTDADGVAEYRIVTTTPASYSNLQINASDPVTSATTTVTNNTQTLVYS